jgi:hypothetical protein
MTPLPTNMTDRWVEDLDEDWVSQPRSPSPLNPSPAPIGTLGTNPDTTNRLSTSSSTHRLSRGRSSDTLGSASFGTTQLHSNLNGSNIDTPEWKRQLKADLGGKDLFSPLELETLFRPPSSVNAPPSPPPTLPPPREQPSPQRRNFHLPTQNSNYPSPLSTLPEEAGSGGIAEPVKHLYVAPYDQTQDARPVLRPLNRHSMLHPTRHLQASPPEEHHSPTVGRYSDLMSPPEDRHSSTAQRYTGLWKPSETTEATPRNTRPCARRRQQSSPQHQTSEDRRHEVISPVSMGELVDSPMENVPVLRRGQSNPETNRPRRRCQRRRYGSQEEHGGEEEQEEDDEHEEDEDEDDGMMPGDSASVRRFMQTEEVSVYPSSPPGYRGQYPQRRDYEEDEEEEEPEEEGQYDDEEYAEGHLPFRLPREPPPTPPSPDRRPSIDSRTSKEGPTVNTIDPNGSDLLRNIRNHKEAPRSSIRLSEDPGSNGDPFFTQHPFLQPRSEPETPTTAGSEMQRNGSPLKLFSGTYDTYTKEKLRKRLGELEGGEEEQPPNRIIDFDQGESDADDESEHQHDGASLVVNRLEAMARKIEEQDHPPPGKTYVRKSKMQTPTTVSNKYINGHLGQLSAPSASPIRPPSIASGRKHRRWRSDESSVAPNDGVAAPRSPVKERTPKRPRRGTVILPRPGSSDTPQSPATDRRRRVYTAIAEGSILASSRRQQRSRANSKESQVLGRKSHITNAAAAAAVVDKASPTPTARKRKQHRMKDAGAELLAVPPRNGVQRNGPRKIIFSGTMGDGMQGESFEMPTPVRENNLGNRRGSINTQDFLQEAEAVMARLRAVGLSDDSEEEEEDELDFDEREHSSGRSSRRGSNTHDDNGVVLPHSRGSVTQKDEGDPGSTSMRLQAVADKLNGCQGRFPTSMDCEQRGDDMGLSRSSTKSSRSSVRVISNDPEVLTHHLATKTANDMTFDKATHAWISRTPGKEGEEDPLRDISDLTVDSKEEARMLEHAKAQWNMLGSTPNGVEKSGLWRSSRVIDETDLRQLRSSCGGAGGDTWDKSNWGRSQALGSSTGSSGSQESDNEVHAEAETGPEETTDKNVKETEMPHDNEDDDGENDAPDVKLSARFDDAFSSSPLKHEVRLDDDDAVDGFLEHGSLRRRNSSSLGGLYRGSARRKSLGKSFIGRSVSRIEEEEASLRGRFRKSLSSALTPLGTPFNMSIISNLPPPSTNNKRDVSFFLSPLPDLSYRFETTELIALELSYITQRRGLKPTSQKAIEATFSIAQEILVKHLTDVEPYDPYWDFIKCLKLSDRKLETLHSLNEWCPRISELDVSNNLLGQLSGVPESVLTLNVQRNCLSGLTFFGHLTNLQYLDVSGNGLESLEALRVCQHLREVKADDNSLTSIDGVFSIAGLQSLRCRRNRLETVDLSTCGLYAPPLPLKASPSLTTAIANASPNSTCEATSSRQSLASNSCHHSCI